MKEREREREKERDRESEKERGSRKKERCSTSLSVFLHSATTFYFPCHHLELVRQQVSF